MRIILLCHGAPSESNMDTPAGPPLEQVRGMQRCVNDLIRLLAFPTMWSGLSSSQIVSSFAEDLLRMLQLDMVYVRLTASEHLLAAADVRSDPFLTSEALAGVLRSASDHPRQMTLADGRRLSLEPLHLGILTRAGSILVGSQRSDFPLETEQALLTVAANQLLVVLQEIQLAERKTIEAQLRASERELSQIVNSIPALAWSARADGSAAFFS